MNTRLVCAAAVFVVVAVWLGGRAPAGPGWRDGAEINLAAQTLSLIHPPGAPLHALSARAAAAIPPAADADLRVNRLSSLLLAAAAAGVFLVVAGDGRGRRGSLSLALAAVIWALAVPGVAQFGSVGEVYAAAALLGLVVFAAGRSRRSRVRLLSAYALGLGLGVHPLLICLVPVVGWQRGRAPVLALLGASTFLLLPLRSVFEPPLDWGDPQTWSGFVDVVTAAEFSSGLRDLRYAEAAPLGTLGESLAAAGRWSGALLAGVGLAANATRLGRAGAGGSLVGLGALLWTALQLGGGIDVEGYLLVPSFLLATQMGGLLLLLPRRWALPGASIAALAVAIPAAGGIARAPAPTSIARHAAQVVEHVGIQGVLLADTTVDYFALLHLCRDRDRAPVAIYTPLLARAWYRRALRARRPGLLVPEPDGDHLEVAAALARRIVRENRIPCFYSPASRSVFPLNWLAPRGPVFRVAPAGPPLIGEPAWSPRPAPPLDSQWALRLGLVNANRALVLAARGRPAEALHAWSEAARMRPRHPETARRYAAALLAADDPTRAAAELDRALGLAPQSAALLSLRSRAALHLGDLPGAQRLARDAVAAAPTDPQAHAALGAALVATHDLERAGVHLRRAAELGSADPAVASLLRDLERARRR